MEEQNEILAAVKDGFRRVDEQFANVNERFAQVDERFAKVDERFAKMDEHFRTLRRELAEQLDGVSDSLHAEVRTHGEKVVQQVESVRALIERVDSKLGLIGESTAHVMTEIGRYHTNVQAPLEQRVVKLEGRVLALERKK